MSDKGSKKSGIASLRKAVKPDVECKVAFLGKWCAGTEISPQLWDTIRSSLTSTGGIKTKLRFSASGLRIGEKTSIFSVFPDQLYPIPSIKAVKKDDKQTNAVLVTTQNDAQIYEICAYRLPSEYEAQKVMETYEKYKRPTPNLPPTAPASVDDDNWTLRETAAKKYPSAVIATPTVNGINGHNEPTKVTSDPVNKTLHIQLPEPIYATVKKSGHRTDLEERVRALENENARLMQFIQTHLVTKYQALPMRQTDVPVDNLLMLEGNRLKPMPDDVLSQTYSKSESSSLTNSGQFERGGLHYQRNTASMNGYATSSSGYQAEQMETHVLVPVETLRRNVKAHTYVTRKIGDVYKPPVIKQAQVASVPVVHDVQYQDVAESLPPRDSISSLDSDLEDSNANDGVFEITTPTSVRYM